MAQIRFEDLDFSNNKSSGNNAGYPVNFFSLKNDGDEAIVRIMHDCVEDFDIVSTHEVREDGKYRGRMSCVRDPKDDLSKCPACAAGLATIQRMYIHLIHYVQDETGNIVPKAEVWERSTFYAQQIKSYIDNYGPMSDIICKIIRHGGAGDQKTKYEIIPNLNKQVYRDDIYVKDTSLFENFHSVGTVVMNKSIEDMSTFIQTGHFPQKQKANNTPNNIPVAPTPSINTIPVQPQTASQPAYVGNTVPDGTAPIKPTTAAPITPNSIPQTPGYGFMNASAPNSDAPLDRPVRSYY